ncbi:hypothetical protein ACRUMN_09160 [Kluyvera cryocrescens]|uniref:hypothetical protein n=1 Tax=Kluyvera cryocrescens TaxID=580 RepID=UPI003D7FBC14
MHSAVAFGFTMDSFVVTKTDNVAGIDIEINVGVAPRHQIADMILPPGSAMAAANKPGTVLRRPAAKGADGRGNEMPVTLVALTVQKQTKCTATIAHGRLGNHHGNRQKAVRVVLQITAHIKHTVFRINHTGGFSTPAE